MNLEYNNAGEGVHAIAESLQGHKSITSIDLTANQVRQKARPVRTLNEQSKNVQVFVGIIGLYTMNQEGRFEL